MGAQAGFLRPASLSPVHCTYSVPSLSPLLPLICSHVRSSLCVFRKGFMVASNAPPKHSQVAQLEIGVDGKGMNNRKKGKRSMNSIRQRRRLGPKNLLYTPEHHQPRVPPDRLQTNAQHTTFKRALRNLSFRTHAHGAPGFFPNSPCQTASPGRRGLLLTPSGPVLPPHAHSGALTTRAHRGTASLCLRIVL